MGDTSSSRVLSATGREEQRGIMRNQILKSFATLGLFLASGLVPVTAQYYKVTNILSDGSVPAIVTDPNFINPWAVSASGTWWMST
jgi:hypothetical protein